MTTEEDQILRAGIQAVLDAEQESHRIAERLGSALLAVEKANSETVQSVLRLGAAAATERLRDLYAEVVRRYTELATSIRHFDQLQVDYIDAALPILKKLPREESEPLINTYLSRCSIELRERVLNHL